MYINSKDSVDNTYKRTLILYNFQTLDRNPHNKWLLHGSKQTFISLKKMCAKKMLKQITMCVCVLDEEVWLMPLIFSIQQEQCIYCCKDQGGVGVGGGGLVIRQAALWLGAPALLLNVVYVCKQSCIMAAQWYTYTAQAGSSIYCTCISGMYLLPSTSSSMCG